MTRALLIIDVQQGMCEGEGAAWDCANVIARINRVAAHARASGVPVVFIQHEDATELIHGSRAWQLADGLLAEPDDLRVRKTTPDSFLRTELQAVLSARVCGRSTATTCWPTGWCRPEFEAQRCTHTNRAASPTNTTAAARLSTR